METIANVDVDVAVVVVEVEAVEDVVDTPELGRAAPVVEVDVDEVVIEAVAEVENTIIKKRCVHDVEY